MMSSHRALTKTAHVALTQLCTELSHVGAHLHARRVADAGGHHSVDHRRPGVRDNEFVRNRVLWLDQGPEVVVRTVEQRHEQQCNHDGTGAHFKLQCTPHAQHRYSLLKQQVLPGPGGGQGAFQRRLPKEEDDADLHTQASP